MTSVGHVSDSASSANAIGVAVETLGGPDIPCNIGGVLHFGVSSECADADTGLFSPIAPRMEAVGKPKEIAAMVACLALQDPRFVPG